MKRSSFSHLLLLTAATILPVAAQSFRNEDPCGKVDSWSVIYDFGREERASAHSNDKADVHKPVLENVLYQLRTRVGNDFIKNLYFTHVEGVDFDRDTELSLRNLKRIDAYDFTYEVRIGEGGVYRYAFSIGTDKTGKFLQDVEIPDIASSTEKGIIQPCVDAIDVARKTEVLTQTRQIFVRLRFDKPENVFVWDVYGYREGGSLHSDHVWLNANNLAVIKKYDQIEAF